MDLLVTQMTANRLFSKARRRVAERIDQLSDSVSEIDLSDDGFASGIIVVFVDEPEDFFREVPNRDSVYQVNVGIPSGLQFLPSDDRTYLEKVSIVLERVFLRIPIAESQRKHLQKALRNWTDFQGT